MTKELIFELRRTIDAMRQPSRTTVLEELIASVESLPATQPYDLSFATKINLCTIVHAFATGAQGPPATLFEHYLYRLCSIGTLRQCVEWRNPTNDVAAYDDVVSAHLSANDWMPLSRFATGVFQNYRAFSWWTPFDLTSVKIWEAWRRVGLLDDWVMHDSVLLRAREPHRHNVKVPDVVDGFEGPVFEAAREIPPSVVGRAINLSARPFAAGEIEIVTPPVSVSDIEVLPVAITPGDRAKGVPARDDMALWQELERYYRACS